MNTSGEAPSLLGEPAFRRLLLWSTGGHIVLAAALLFAPRPHPVIIGPTPVFVEVATAVPAPPPPPPKQRIEEPVVIPKEPAKQRPKPKPPEPKKRALPPKSKPEPKVEKPPEPRVEDLLDSLRSNVAARESADKETAFLAAGPGRVDPERAAYHKTIKSLLYANWAGARSFRTQPGLQVAFAVELLPSGALRSVRMMRSSGNTSLDESAERAIHKVAPFPAPPRGLTALDLIFDPRELL